MTAPSMLSTRDRSLGFRNPVQWPALVLLALIRIYQRILSPVLPVLTMGRCGCRFSPTCSHYAAEAIQVHGAVRGIGLALVRLVKCTPLHPGGDDPVPSKNTDRAKLKRPRDLRCVAVR
jgi:putative membrane protein insertion efficiency factor